MAYDLIVGAIVEGDCSAGIGDDEDGGLPSDNRSASFVWTGPYVPGKDAVDNVDATYPEETFKAAMSRLASLSPADKKRRREWQASRRPRWERPTETSGHALQYDSLGRATIVDVGHHGGHGGGRGRGRGGRGGWGRGGRGWGWGPAYYEDVDLHDAPWRRRPIFIDPSQLPPGVQAVSGERRSAEAQRSRSQSGAGLLDAVAPGTLSKMQKLGLPPEQVATMQLAAGVPPLAVANMLYGSGWAKAKVQAFLREQGSEVELAGRADEQTSRRADEQSLSGGGASPKATVLKMQAQLQGIGLPVKKTGKLDADTVHALNSVFEGSDDAPEALRSGSLTPKQVAANLPLVARTLTRAVGGAKGFDQLEEG